jgi:coenzyme PQQ synthesis protein D (PqqD)
MQRPATVMPRARTGDLVIERLAEETLVYDLRRHRAHCLNPAASLVWQCCDGRTTVAAVARRLARELPLPVDEALVWTGLEQLARARLLGDRPAAVAVGSRRELVRALGLGAAAAVLLPVVESIVSPTAAQAASCLTSAECGALVPPQCTGQPICGSTTNCCMSRNQRCTTRPC